MAITAWSRTVDLYLDVNAVGGLQPILDGTSSAQGEAPVFISGDRFLLRLWFRVPAATGQSSGPAQLPSGFNLVLAAKAAPAEGEKIADLPTLFYADGFSEVGADDELHYESMLDLNTAELAAALASASSVAVWIDVEVQQSGNTERATFRIATTVYRQVYEDQAQPTPGAPPYPSPGELVCRHADGASLVIKDGQHPYLYCPHCGDFFPLRVSFENGAHVLALGEGETL